MVDWVLRLARLSNTVIPGLGSGIHALSFFEPQGVGRAA
jgi:hypothetical protein